jgi:hypothetical protein
MDLVFGPNSVPPYSRVGQNAIPGGVHMGDKIAKISPEQYRCLAIGIYTNSEAFDPL